MAERHFLPLLLTLGTALFAQYDYLNPAGYPEAMSCDLTVQEMADFDNLYRGETPIQVGLTPPDPARPGKYLSPKIDGVLEDSIWFHAEALGVHSWMVVNNWSNAPADNCVISERRYFGPRDLHAIWRFMYNNEALFISCQVHDDVHFVDTARTYDRSDGVEIALDPWDWEYYARRLWDPINDNFRRYRYWNGNLIRQPDSSQKCFVYLQKPLNSGIKASGLVRAQDRVYDYVKAAAGYRPFQKGDPDLYGVEFACTDRGNDEYNRTVYHVEFKIPFHSGIFRELETRGYFDAKGYPLKGNRFKMNFSNNDLDSILPVRSGVDTTQWIPGRSKYVQLNTRRSAPFWEYRDSLNYRWSDTKYFPVFQFSDKVFSGVHPWPEWGTRTEAGSGALPGAPAFCAAPNPFNPVTTLRMAGGEGPAVFTIFNTAGKRVARLAAADGQGVRWNASGFPSGVYLVSAVAGKYSRVEKIVLQK